MAEAPVIHPRRIPVRISLDPGLLTRVDEVARLDGIKRSELVGRLLQQALEEEEEDRLLARAAEEAYHDPDNQERIPFAAVKARLGL